MACSKKGRCYIGARVGENVGLQATEYGVHLRWIVWGEALDGVILTPLSLFFLSDLATILVLQAGSERAPHALRFLGN